MKKIASFTIDHLTLMPGVYLSRQDHLPVPCTGCDRAADTTVCVSTYDLRMTAPNREPVMSTGEVHAIEHIAATYLRNRPDIADRVVYFGPMGCRTGFYLILSGSSATADLVPVLYDTFSFVADYEDEIPGAAPKDCGNYSDMDLEGAKERSAVYAELLRNITPDRLTY